MSFLTNKQYLLLFLFILFSQSTSTNILNPTQTLSGNQTLISSGGAFALGFFTLSTNTYLGIWYNNIKVHTIVWVANRRDPVGPSATLTLTLNSTLLIKDHNSTFTICSSNSTNTVLQLLDTGNLVVLQQNGNYAWQSFDYPTDTLLPGMKLGWNLTSGLNRNLTAWRSPTDPSPGDYYIVMDIRGDPQLTVFMGSIRKWRSGPWDGREITGIPEMLNYTGFKFHFIVNSTDIYYSYDVLDPTIITRLMVNESGTAQRYVWLNDTSEWGLFWYTPKTPCDAFSPCGPYGLCNPNDSPMCSCLQGFRPKNQQEWQLRDGSAGCTRKTELRCGNGAVADGFMKVSNAWLPDTSVATVDRSLSIDECRTVCERNCSCTGYASADVRGGGSGCIIWASELQDLEIFVNGGQDLFVRLAKIDLPSATVVMGHSHKNRARTVVAATVSAILGGLLLTFVACFVRRKKRERHNGEFDGQWCDESSKGEEELELPLLDLATVIAATDNFKEDNKLGEGGFGPVYKGKLIEGQDIAVKRLSKTSIQGPNEFKNEVTLIAKLQHRNLVRLIGCCIHAEERMLIYEYMPNKSLDAFLFDKVNGVPLNWSIRYHIIMGIARGIIYLHQDSRFRIIHRDLKASNILLDKEMNPKISDFGLARIFGGDDAITKTRRVVGTYGYMSPEYAMDGIFSVKSDVFSFGVLVLEIISGRKNKGVYISEPHVYLLGTAWILWNEGKCLELIDPDLECTFSLSEVMRCIKVGLLCVQECAEDRPTMSTALLMLSSDSATLPDPKQPGFVSKRDPPEPNSPSTEKDWNSVNELTNTMSVGR